MNDKPQLRQRTPEEWIPDAKAALEKIVAITNEHTRDLHHATEQFIRIRVIAEQASGHRNGLMEWLAGSD